MRCPQGKQENKPSQSSTNDRMGSLACEVLSLWGLHAFLELIRLWGHVPYKGRVLDRARTLFGGKL